MDLNLLLNPNIPNKANTLPDYITTVLLANYIYFIIKICQLPDYIISEEFLVNQFEANLLVNINNVEDAQKWVADFEEVSKMTMPQTKGYQLKGQKVFFRQLQYCIHSNIVIQKQENPILKNPNSLKVRNTELVSTVDTHDSSGRDCLETVEYIVGIICWDGFQVIASYYQVLTISVL
ncbi:12717_t:CDS:2 [Gigaspora margarita]|uniref:12717_t:CDS:1 n=1 Tax=Gigaspora margarita TaxID=4874 RepID=A0ABN7UXX9_GIGMA|nr:12717_t:CDS:2 [Gigaspora margarita]